jgi:hypothetical protein
MGKKIATSLLCVVLFFVFVFFQSCQRDVITQSELSTHEKVPSQHNSANERAVGLVELQDRSSAIISLRLASACIKTIAFGLFYVGLHIAVSKCMYRRDVDFEEDKGIELENLQTQSFVDLDEESCLASKHLT